MHTTQPARLTEIKTTYSSGNMSTPVYIYYEPTEVSLFQHKDLVTILNKLMNVWGPKPIL